MTDLTLNERDIKFFDEVYNLMKSNYPEMESKFGIWRIHQHFEISEDEVFYETSDAEKKESTLKIIKKKDLPKNASKCTWKLTQSGPVGVIECGN